MSAARVTSEIGRLRTVMVHAPGAEIDRMVPNMMEQLLFDDILFGEHAREEHGAFTEVLKKLGIEVLDVQDLLEETLQIELARRWLLEPMLEVTSRPVKHDQQRDRAAQQDELLPGSIEQQCDDGKQDVRVPLGADRPGRPVPRQLFVQAERLNQKEIREDRVDGFPRRLED